MTDAAGLEPTKFETLSLLVHAAAKVGKALALATPVVTPSGWTTIGELSVGDEVFDGSGEPTTVVALSPIWYDRPCYDITLIEGDVITADADHIWLASPNGGSNGDLTLFRTRELRTGKGYRRLAWTPTLNLPDVDLIVPPYVLGLWLGDGCTKGSTISAGFDRSDVLERCVQLWGSGEVRRQKRALCAQLPKLIIKLHEIGAVDDAGVKQVPSRYLRAGVKQRRELLAGLLDSDGHVSKDSKAMASFANTNKNLIDGVYELAHSLGLRARVAGPHTKYTVYPDKTRKIGKRCWDVHIRGVVASDNLTYRGDRQHIPASRHKRYNRVSIMNISRVDSVPVRCIQVANADGLFLAGRSMVPTHNSTLSSTAPTPILVLDAEGGWRFIKRAGFCRPGVHGSPDCTCPMLRRREWDPLTGPPPRWDGTWDFCHVMVHQWSTLTQVLNWLRSAEPHDFRSLVLDSITETQRKLKMNLRGTEQMRIQDWGDLLTNMDVLIRGYRDLVLVKGSPLRLAMFIAETREERGKWRPYMQGQISVSLPYWVDIVGYLYPHNLTDANGQATESVRRLFIGSDPQFESGERVQGVLGDVIERPNVAEMLDRIFPPTAAERDESTAERIG